MELKHIFDVFYRRHADNDKINHHIPETTRQRILMWCCDTFGNRGGYAGAGDDERFWAEIYRAMQMLLGRPRLGDPADGMYPSWRLDAIKYLVSCRATEFISFMEYIFKVDSARQAMWPEGKAVGELNLLLREGKLPYYVTNFIMPIEAEPPSGTPRRLVTRTPLETDAITYPQVIMRENELMHTRVVEPALVLLRLPAFQYPNAEYLGALEEYRTGDLGHCVTKCGSAFESVMKVICDQKKWDHDQSDHASTLIKIMVERLELDSYMWSCLITVPTVRNKASDSHGAGVKPRKVSRQLARYALDSTAAAMIFLAGEADMQ